MASPPRTREEERRLNARTLAIASAASASAAAVTSQLWIAGTWIAAAVTPVIVAIVSELLHRPSERIARAITSDRPVLELDDPDEVPSDAPRPDPEAPRPGAPSRPTGPPAPVRVYRQPASPGRRPRIAVGMVAATAAIALAVAVAVITIPELITGQSLGKRDSATTLFSKSRSRPSSDSEPRSPAPAQEETTPSERTTPAPDEPSTTPTVTTPTETTPPPAATAPAAPGTEP